jgi:hypothetical protein
MRKLLSTFAAAGALALAAAASPAAAIDFGGDFNVDYNTDGGTFGGLVINVSPDSGTFGFSLEDAGDTTDWLPLFTISSPEQSMDFDDLLLWKPIEVTFTFNQPSGFGGSVGGTTGGTTEWKGFFRGWDNEGHVRWDGPESFAFGDTGLLTVKLSKADFDLGSSAGVSAKWTLESLPSAVPEPGTWALMITGFGLAGAALRRQRKLAMTVA